MAYNFQRVEEALDSLGLDYTEGVPFKITEKYKIDYDFSDVSYLLHRPDPAVLLDDVAYDCTLEHKVLEDWEKRRVEREEKLRLRKERIEKYEKERAEELELKRQEEEEKALEEERKRLEEFEAEKERLEIERKEAEEEEERRRLEEEAEAEERQRLEEAEREAEENNKAEDEETEQSSDTAEDKASESSVDPQSSWVKFDDDTKPASPPEQNLPSRSSEITVIGTQTNTTGNVVIDFSDFEAEADPFADLELKTINDLEELQFLSQNQPQPTPPPQQQHQSAVPASSHSSLQSYPPATAGGLGSIPTYYPSGAGPVYPASRYQPPVHPYHGLPSHLVTPSPTLPYNMMGANVTSHAMAPGHRVTTGGPATCQINVRPAVSSPGQLTLAGGPVRSPPTIPAQQHFAFPRPAEPYGNQRPYQAGPSITRTERLKDADDEESSPPPGELKSSRSLGDMISELQKEARMLAEAKRKSANTPPPSGVSRSRPVSGGPPGMENWSPWPELEPKPEPEPDPLEGLEPQQAETCRQLHEMGFPLARLATGVRAVGVDTQNLINYCLLVDRLVEDGNDAAEAEHVAGLHNNEEDACRKHLDSFKKLTEFGFSRNEIHTALLQESGDYQGALEQLLK